MRWYDLFARPSEKEHPDIRKKRLHRLQCIIVRVNMTDWTFHLPEQVPVYSQSSVSRLTHFRVAEAHTNQC